MKRSKKIIGVIIMALMLSIMTPCFAVEYNGEIEKTVSPVEMAEKLLNKSTQKQAVIVTEKEYMEQMMEVDPTAREKFNSRAAELSTQSTGSLLNMGYSMNQARSIHNYKEGEDAFNYFFGPQSTYASAKLTMLFGLAGSDNTKKTVKIAFDTTWSSPPLYLYRDSIAIGWILADSMSKEIMAKIDNYDVGIQYYSRSTEKQTSSADINIEHQKNFGISGEVPMTTSISDYAKKTGGVITVSTQSNSYNISTVQIFAAYGQTTVRISVDTSVSINLLGGGGTVNFQPKATVEQTLIIDSAATFDYDSQEYETVTT